MRDGDDRLRELVIDRPGPITWAVIRRSLTGATLAGVFLSFIRAFGSGAMPFPQRTAYMVGIAMAGTLIGTVTFRLACRIPGLEGRRFVQGAVSGVMMSPLMAAVVWFSEGLPLGARAPISAWPAYFGNTVVMCVIFTLGAVSLNRRAYLASLAATSLSPAPPKFLERLPVKLRGAEIWAVEAEDHYLRVHTDQGQDLILLRLADAIDELVGLEGAQVHRSWWVARAAIADARRGDGRAVLTLKDGSEVPVSRTYAKALRDSGWI